VRRVVVVSSVIANKPHNGGNARMVLNWLQGLEQLGLDVFFVEQIRGEHCVDAQGSPAPASHSANRAYFDDVLKTHGFSRRAALICDVDGTLDAAVVHGATASELHDLADAADLLINISGHLSVRALKQRFRRKAYVDLDPGYTQLWHTAGSSAARLEGHDVYFTVGQRIGTVGCRIPTDGIAWHAIRQPIVLTECRPDAPVHSSPRFTTIASWRGAYAPITHEGETYAAKAHEFRKFVEGAKAAGHENERHAVFDETDFARKKIMEVDGHVGVTIAPLFMRQFDVQPDGFSALHHAGFGAWRFLLAVLVAVSHLWGGMIHGPAAYAVWGFFVLSGYLMTLVLGHKYGTDAAGIRAYAANRVLRIYPSYVVAVLLGIATIWVLRRLGADPAGLNPQFLMPNGAWNCCRPSESG